MLHTELSTGFVDCLTKAAYAMALRLLKIKKAVNSRAVEVYF